MTAEPGVVVVGAGGHAKVVVAALLELGEPVSTILDDDPDKQGGQLLGLPVGGPVAGYPAAGRPGIMAIGDNAARQQLSVTLDCAWRTVVHPAAYVHPSVQLGEGAFVAAGAVVQPDTVIGAHAIINTGATVDHDCVVGSYAHVAPGAHLAGQVSIGEGTLVGLGAGIAAGVSVGDWAVLGAGAAAVRDLPDRATAIGLPARVRDDD